jgi:UDP-N-acetylmuramoyl-tripeptide--D-alanyl-D-alanine ligase
VNFWTAENIRTVTRGSWLRRPPSDGRPAPEIDGLSTDTRTLRRGQVFLALSGPTYDGHQFLVQAAAAGAALIIVDDADSVSREMAASPDFPAIIKVRHTLGALGALAAAYRKTLESVRVIAVCGANGKTTTTRLIHSILSTRLRGSASPKSFNNAVGVPLTILGAKPSDQYLACEVGTNAPGETARLARIIQPDIAVITSVGRAHIEFFDSLNAVVEEDAAIFQDVRPHGAAIIPARQPLLADFARTIPNVVTFGDAADADLRLTTVAQTTLSDGRSGLKFSVNARSEFELPLLGEHNAHNALAAIAVARRLGLDDASIAQGLLAVTPADMRLMRRSIAGVDLLIDCYNANPESAAAAVRTFAALFGGARRRVLILGDMLELGAHARDCHLELANVILGACRADLVVTVGPHALHIAETLSQAWSNTKLLMLSELTDEQARRVAMRLEPGDAVLLKGSRGTRLERIVQALEAAPPSKSTSTTAGAGVAGRSGGSPAHTVV